MFCIKKIGCKILIINVFSTLSYFDKHWQYMIVPKLRLKLILKKIDYGLFL